MRFTEMNEGEETGLLGKVPFRRCCVSGPYGLSLRAGVVGGLGQTLGLGRPQLLEAIGVSQITEERVQGDKGAWVPPLPIPGDSDIYTQAQEE